MWEAWYEICIWKPPPALELSDLLNASEEVRRRRRSGNPRQKSLVSVFEKEGGITQAVSQSVSHERRHEERTAEPQKGQHRNYGVLIRLPTLISRLGRKSGRLARKVAYSDFSMVN